VSDSSSPASPRSAEHRVSAGSSSPGARKKHPAFWFTNHVLNPILKATLRSAIGRRWGHRMAVVTYQGRRTTARHELVTMYARDATNRDVVWIVPGQPDKKLWWRNFRSSGNVELLLAGEVKRGTAIAIEGRVNPDTVALGLEAYLQAFPRARRTIEKGSRNPQETARRTVIVRVQLID
jgi:hypothetical protein